MDDDARPEMRSVGWKAVFYDRSVRKESGLKLGKEVPFEIEILQSEHLEPDVSDAGQILIKGRLQSERKCPACEW